MPATTLTWDTPAGRLEARATDLAALRAHAQQLADWYNEPFNREMMSNTATLTAEDVIEGFRSLDPAGSRPFLLYRDGALVGDGDFRHIGPAEAEFAIMVGPRASQGQGLGTRLSILLHAYAFDVLKLDYTFLSIVPANQGGRRCYEKVGYTEDLSCRASRYAELTDDVTMSLAREHFRSLHADALSRISIVG